ncbi:hypothetical protein ACFOPX_02235 [Helicobacter baculiformis]|uniref:DUF2306 domain-containing protein n=1 Tax=Helicobacter baculiformis TaxID=427351 RepID=A0ABV7ZH54_9HELI|nr:hypothetical protein [Helicobacter baculiformis]
MLSKKTTPYKVFVASVFFVLVVCNALALLFSHFNHNFAQLFTLLNARFYAVLVHSFHIVGALGSLFYFVRASKHNALAPKLIALGSCAAFVYLVLLGMHGFFLWGGYVLVLGALGGLWMRYAHARALISFAPSLNTCIIWVFACGFQTYLYPQCVGLDFALFVGVLLGLVGVVARRKEYLGFYEYANLLVLCAGLVVFMLCAPVIVAQESARQAFFWLGILAWIGEWMHTSMRPHT